jgi:hypothetical protein
MAECADILQPGTFWSAHDVMYELTIAQFNALTPFTFAARTGLNYDELSACVQETANQVETDVELARSIEVSGTPSILVRYDDGDLEDIEVDGTTVSRSSVPLLVLATVIEEAQSTAE